MSMIIFSGGRITYTGIDVPKIRKIRQERECYNCYKRFPKGSYMVRAGWSLCIDCFQKETLPTLKQELKMVWKWYKDVDKEAKKKQEHYDIHNKNIKTIMGL